MNPFDGIRMHGHTERINHRVDHRTQLDTLTHRALRSNSSDKDGGDRCNGHLLHSNPSSKRKTVIGGSCRKDCSLGSVKT